MTPFVLPLAKIATGSHRSLVRLLIRVGGIFPCASHAMRGRCEMAKAQHTRNDQEHAPMDKYVAAPTDNSRTTRARLTIIPTAEKNMDALLPRHCGEGSHPTTLSSRRPTANHNAPTAATRANDSAMARATPLPSRGSTPLPDGSNRPVMHRAGRFTAAKSFSLTVKVR
jgi:hypothetical protein